MGDYTFVFLVGNLSTGYMAYGPYESLGEACDAHDFEDGWVMQVHKKVMATSRSDES
jgi:hypothetical protein